jgi:hypothetical protein
LLAKERSGAEQHVTGKPESGAGIIDFTELALLNKPAD